MFYRADQGGIVSSVNPFIMNDVNADKREFESKWDGSWIQQGDNYEEY